MGERGLAKELVKNMSKVRLSVCLVECWQTRKGESPHFYACLYLKEESISVSMVFYFLLCCLFV